MSETFSIVIGQAYSEIAKNDFFTHPRNRLRRNFKYGYYTFKIWTFVLQWYNKTTENKNVKYNKK